MGQLNKMNQKMHDAKIACLVLLANYLCIIGSTHAESLEDLGAIIQIQQTRSFSDIDLFTATVSSAPNVISNIPEGGNPALLIKNKYGFGVSDSKEAYDILVKQILDLNNAPDARHLAKGEVIVPDLPLMTSAIPLPTPASAETPTFSNQSELASVFGSNNSISRKPVFSQAIYIPKPIKESLNYLRIEKYPAAEAHTIFNQMTSRGLAARIGSEAGIKITATDGDCLTSTTNILSLTEKTKIEAALSSTNSKLEHYLIILDTGWPTYEQQLSSMRNVRHIFDVARASLRIPEQALTRFNPELKRASFIPPTHNHACMIYNSLREFTSLEKSEQLKIIYLPLRPGQPMAADYFRELIELTQVMEGLGAEASGRTPTSEEITNAKKFANSALKDLIALNTPWVSGDDVVRIYEPLVRGLVAVLDRYAKPEPSTTQTKPNINSRFIINLSWNFTKFAYPPSLPSSKSYMVFAAAGNDNTDFVIANRLFASEAAGGNKVFAVMNSDEKTGRNTCNSSFFHKLWDADNSNTNIASFPGRLENMNANCPGPGGGTSFSTPRLAWLSALSSISLDVESEDWTRLLIKRLLKSRGQVASDQNAAPIDVEKLLNTK